MFPESKAGSGRDSKANRDQGCSTGGAISESDTVIITTAANFERLWEEAQIAVDEAESVRNLAKILSSERGREFISNLDRTGTELCIEILDKVRSGLPSSIHGYSLTNGMIQGLAKHAPRATEKQIFLNTLMKLAGKHLRLPSSMVITEGNDFSCSRWICAAGGFADIRQGWCNGYTVAVKTIRLHASDNLEQVGKVSGKSVFAPWRRH